MQFIIVYLFTIVCEDMLDEYETEKGEYSVYRPL